jgi:hypothetical protein
MGRYTGKQLRQTGLTRLLIYSHTHRRPGKEDHWHSNVAGLSKRDLLKDVLSVFGTENDCFSYFAVVLNTFFQVEARRCKDSLRSGKIY